MLQFLLLLKQTKDATDRSLVLELNGELVQLGTIRDLVHMHKDDSEITATVSFRLPDSITVKNPSESSISSITSGSDLELMAQVLVRNRIAYSSSIEYRIGDRLFRLGPKYPESPQFELSSDLLTEERNSFNFVRTTGRAWKLPGPVKSYAFPDQARTYYQNAGFLADLEAAYEKQLDKIFYLGPLREYPKRDYLWARSRPSDVGQRGEKTIDAILAASDAKETRNIGPHKRHKPFQEMIAYWLRELGLIESFNVVELVEGSNRWQARVRTRKGASEVLLTDVGFGVSQVLPVITLLQYVPEGSTVVLEQPEIHLHPLAQAGLADVIIQAAVHRSVQVIVESHSEHLLLRLQRRLAEQKISKEDIGLYFCDAPEGVSNLTRLELDMYGNVNSWPENFMGDAFGETAKAELARLRRMKLEK